MSDPNVMINSIPMPNSEPFPGKTYIADGWVYRDLPRLSYEMFDKFVDIVGEENMVWLTEADYGDSKRGQLLVSPAGMERVRNHVGPSTPNQAEAGKP
jgi:hypothetical protein